MIRPLLWTCADFHRAGDFGLFEGRRAMLIDGVILERGPITPAFAVALELTGGELRKAFAPGRWVRGQMPLPLGPRTDPCPSLAVVPGEPRSHKAHPTTASLIVEVSDTTLHFDTGDNLELYARAGVPEYWVLDLNARELLVYRDPHGTAYRTQQTFGPADAVSPLAAPTATVRVADLLP